MGHPGQRIRVHAPSVRDHGQQARADGGVRVEFRTAGEELVSSVQASRLVLAHGADRMELGGQVVLRFGDSLEVLADTLLWEGERQKILIPGRLRVETPLGWEEGEGLEADCGVQAWSMEGVHGQWQGEEAYRIEVRARRARGHRVQGQLTMAYDSATVQHDGLHLHGPQATFRQAEHGLYFAGGVSGRDSTRRFSAEQVDVDLKQGKALARGSVVLNEPDMSLQARELVLDRRSREWQAQGDPALFVQGERRLEARRFSYGEASARLEAQGGVIYRQGERLLEAGHLVYGRREEHLWAEGGIALRAPELGGTLRGGALFHDLRQEQGQLRQNPQLRRAAAGAQELVLEADSMGFDLGQARLAATGEVRLEAGTLKGRADRGQYAASAERVLLAGQVVVEQEEEERQYRSRLEADSLIVELEQGRVARLVLPGRVKGVVEAAGGRLSWIEGQGGQGFFASGRLERIEINAQADVTHRHLGKDEVSRFQGSRMVLEFGDQGLQRAWVGGQAQLVSRLPEKEGEAQVVINQVRGEELEILFAGGSIDQVRMGPTVEGSYYPPPKEK
jgi:lipopolysaccharide export system protein LptA